MSRPLHVLRPGVWRDKNGKTVALSTADCAAIVASHEPRRAPIVIGHGPHKDSDRAHGWAGEARQRSDGSVEVDPVDVSAELAAANESGAYRYQSCELRRLTPGGPFRRIRRVSMLGAVPPAIDGLDEARLYSDGEGDVLMFSDGDGDALLVTMPAEAAAAAGGLVDGLTDAFRRLISGEGPALAKRSDTTTGGNVTSTNPSAEELSRRETALAEREAALAARDQAVADREAALSRRESAAAAAEQEAFVSAHVKAGRLTPLQKPAMIALLSALEPLEVQLAAVQGESQGRKLSATEFLRGFIESSAVQVPAGELSGGSGAPTGATTEAIAARARELRAGDGGLSVADANLAAAIELSGGAS